MKNKIALAAAGIMFLILPEMSRIELVATTAILYVGFSLAEETWRKTKTEIRAERQRVNKLRYRKPTLVHMKPQFPIICQDDDGYTLVDEGWLKNYGTRL